MTWVRVLLFGFLIGSALEAQYARRASLSPIDQLFQKADQAYQKGTLADANQAMADAWAQTRKAGPDDPAFAMNVQRVSQYYLVQGYVLKAEAIAKQGLEMLPPEATMQVRIQLLQLLAQVYGNDQRTRKAQQVWEQALTDGERSLGSRSVELVQILSQLGSLQEMSGQLDEAEVSYKRIDDIQRNPEPSTAQHRSVTEVRGALPPMTGRMQGMIVMNGVSLVAQFYSRHNRTAEAEKIYREAVSRAEQAEPPNREAVISALTQYQWFFRSLQRTEEAIAIQSKIVQIRESVLKENGTAGSTYERQQLANLYAEVGQAEKGLTLMQNELAGIAQTKGRDSADYRNSLQGYASLLQQQQRWNDAAIAWEEVISASQKVDAKENYWAANAIRALTDIRRQQGNKSEAERLEEQLRTMESQQRHEWDPTGVHTNLQQAQLMMSKQNAAGAKASYEAALTVLEQASPVEVVSGALQANGLSYGLLSAGSPDEAERLLLRVLAIQERILGADHPQMVQALYPLVNLYDQQNRPLDAQRTIERQIRLITSARGADSPTLAQQLRGLATHYERQQKLAEAEKTFNDAAAIYEEAQGPNSGQLSDLFRELARVQERRENLAKAEQSWLHAVQIREAQENPQDPSFLWMLADVADFYARQQRFDEALKYADLSLARAQGSAGNGNIAGLTERRERILKMKATDSQPPTKDASQKKKASPFGASLWFDRTDFKP